MIRLITGAALAALALGTQAQQTFNLTIGSSHPLTIPWVGHMKTTFQAEIDKQAAGKYKINWREVYGGQLYKINATLASVSDGLADIGWVWPAMESAKMPLSQVPFAAPFMTNDPRVMIRVMNEMVETFAPLRAEWDKNNIVFLGSNATDTYHLFTKFPVNSIADLKGKKILAPGVTAQWMRGTGVTTVDGALTTYYTDIQTGLADGVLSIPIGILPFKIHEVAPVITLVGVNVPYTGGIGINKDTWAKLPKDLQQIMVDAGKKFSEAVGNDLVARHEAALKTMQETGAKQNPPVKVVKLADAERQKWIDGLPDLAGEWIKATEARGLPAKAAFKAYMDLMRKAGAKPERAWDKGL